MAQTKKGSATEAVTNIAVGYGVNIGVQSVLFPMYGIHMSMHQNLSMGIVFTVVSLIRSYILRRLFNKFDERN